MRRVLHSPIAAMLLIRDIKHPEEQSRFSFLGYLRYFFGYSREYERVLDAYFRVNLLVPRSKREEAMVNTIREFHRMGFVSDYEYRTLLMSLFTIARTIKRYKLIFAL